MSSDNNGSVEPIAQSTQDWQTKRGTPEQAISITVRELAPSKAIFYKKDEYDEGRRYRYQVVEARNIIPIRPGHFLTQGRFEQLVENRSIDVYLHQPLSEDKSRDIEDNFPEIDGLYHELPEEEYRRFQKGERARRSSER